MKQLAFLGHREEAIRISEMREFQLQESKAEQSEAKQSNNLGPKSQLILSSHYALPPRFHYALSLHTVLRCELLPKFEPYPYGKTTYRSRLTVTLIGDAWGSWVRLSYQGFPGPWTIFLPHSIPSLS